MAKNSPILIDIGQGMSLMVGLPRVGTWSSRPKKPRRGAIGFNTNSNQLEYYDGKDWLAAPMSRS